MIGVMGSAVFPGRIGEPTRVLVLSRRLEGSARRLLPVLAGTVFSQTIINLLALAILATVTFTSVRCSTTASPACSGCCSCRCS